MGKRGLFLVVVVALVAGTGISNGEVEVGTLLHDLHWGGDSCGAWGMPPLPCRCCVPGFSMDLGIRKFINSFCSYQFPDNDTDTDPLSRLEFPIDNWFWGVQASQVFSNMCFSVEFWSRLNTRNALKMQDSDWGQFGFPGGQKTTFSESSQRVADGWMVDVNVDYSLGPRLGACLRPVAGYRYQTFCFIAGDGFQYSLNPASQGPLNGDTFDVRFTFQHLYIGGRACFSLGRLGLTLQADYGWVGAKEVDQHLLRGDRLTKDTDGGSCWHLFASMGMVVRDSLSLRLESDFKRLVVLNCNHYWNEGDGTPIQTWWGAKIWSDQQSVAGYAEFRF